MENVAVLWSLSGIAAWLWIMCRNDMVDGFGDGVVAALMIFPACVGGPFTWIAVAVSENDGPIRR